MGNFIRMITGGKPKKKTPLVILANETELVFLEKRLDAINEAHKKAHEEVCKKYGKQHEDTWEKITDHLIEKGLIKHKDEQVEFNSGVLYKVEDEK